MVEIFLIFIFFKKIYNIIKLKYLSYKIYTEVEKLINIEYEFA